jgi:hypothetical protein
MQAVDGFQKLDTADKNLPIKRTAKCNEDIKQIIFLMDKHDSAMMEVIDRNDVPSMIKGAICARMIISGEIKWRLQNLNKKIDGL